MLSHKEEPIGLATERAREVERAADGCNYSGNNTNGNKKKSILLSIVAIITAISAENEEI